MDLEITKGETTIDLCKEPNGLITIDMTNEDKVNFNTISLTKRETRRIIRRLTKYCEDD